MFMSSNIDTLSVEALNNLVNNKTKLAFIKMFLRISI